MRDAMWLAFRYAVHYRLRSVILVICVSIAMFLPAAVHALVGYYNRIMIDRADQTPLVIGAKGSAYDLVLNTLYFKGRIEQHVTMAHADKAAQDNLATIIPMYIAYTAEETPLIGTTLDYFSFRNLKASRGTLPQVLGDVVLGAAAARKLGLVPGDKLKSDQEKVYDITSSYPLLMRVEFVPRQGGQRQAHYQRQRAEDAPDQCDDGEDHRARAVERGDLDRAGESFLLDAGLVEFAQLLRRQGPFGRVGTVRRPRAQVRWCVETVASSRRHSVAIGPGGG